MHDVDSLDTGSTPFPTGEYLDKSSGANATPWEVLPEHKIYGTISAISTVDLLAKELAANAKSLEGNGSG